MYKNSNEKKAAFYSNCNLAKTLDSLAACMHACCTISPCFNRFHTPTESVLFTCLELWHKILHGIKAFSFTVSLERVK